MVAQRARAAVRALAVNAARFGDAKHALAAVVFNVRQITPLADYYVVMGAHSHTQIEALYRHITDELAPVHGKPMRVERGKGAGWFVIDYGAVVVHLMLEPVRRFYDLERLWVGARKVRWNEKRHAP